MTLMRMPFLLLTICICARANAQTPSTAVAPHAADSTIVLKVEAAGSVFVDGKLKSIAHNGQVLTISVAPGQHLVSIKSTDGKTIEKIVTSPAGTSTVVLLGDSSEQGSTNDAAGSGPAGSTVPQEVDLSYFTQDDADKLKLDVQLKALDALELYSDELELVKRFNVKNRTEGVEQPLERAKKTYDREVSKGSQGTATTLLRLGKPQMGLLRSEERVHKVEDSIKRQDSLKGKCDSCTGADEYAFRDLANAMILKAVALFATGEQQQAIAVVSEAQLVLSRAKSKTKQKDEVADLTLDIEQSFMKMAAMRALMSDWRGCLETVREVPESDEPLAAEIPDIRLGVWIEARILRFSDNRFMVGSSLATDCAALAAKYPSQTPHLTPASQTVSSSILNQIDGVVRTGRYSTLPDPQVDSGIGNGAPNINIKNDTRYDLTILCAGPSEQSMQIAAGQTSNIPLQAGTYRMVGQVDSPNILPLYKQYSFNSGSTYNFDFYIAAH